MWAPSCISTKPNTNTSKKKLRHLSDKVGKDSQIHRIHLPTVRNQTETLWNEQKQSKIVNSFSVIDSLIFPHRGIRLKKKKRKNDLKYLGFEICSKELMKRVVTTDGAIDNGVFSIVELSVCSVSARGLLHCCVFLILLNWRKIKAWLNTIYNSMMIDHMICRF